MQFSNLKPPTVGLQLSASNRRPPTISIVIPTLNSGKTLRDCLESIAVQDYPKDRIETIIADGGSTDGTLEIISEFSGASNLQPQTVLFLPPTSNLQPPTSNIHVVPNPLKTGEAGKAVGVKAAKNEIIALIDSDNILPERNWLVRMVQPFEDPEIVGSEPLYYTYRKEDGYITRYCALLGMNDPLCLFLGNYDRYSTLTGKWTEMPHKEEDRGNYLKVELDRNHLPTIGANGFLIRRSALLSVFASNLQLPTSNLSFPDYLFDIDVVCELLDSTNATNSINAMSATNPIRFAKVKTGIVHVFSGDAKSFLRKQRRRIKDYLFYDRLGERKYPWKRTSKTKLLRFVLSCLTILPLLAQSIKGYKKRSDSAWFFHPIACCLTLWEYGRGRIGGIFGVGELRRERWRQ